MTYKGITGFGLCRFGFASFGYGDFPPPTEIPVTPWLDPSTNVLQNSRLISQQTGDYVINQYGHTSGMSSIDQEVLLAVKTKLGSAVDQTLGVNYGAAKTTNTDVASLVTQGLQSLINANKISIVQVSNIIGNGGNVTTQVKFVDISTNQIRTVNVG